MLPDQEKITTAPLADAQKEIRSELHEAALQVLSALGQGTRLDVFRQLSAAADEGIGAGHLAKQLGVPHNTLSTHLSILTRAGLINAERVGRNITYRVVPGCLETLFAFLLADCLCAVPENHQSDAISEVS